METNPAPVRIGAAGSGMGSGVASMVRLLRTPEVWVHVEGFEPDPKIWPAVATPTLL